MPPLTAADYEAMIQAALAHEVRRIVLAGGVAANSRLREKFKERADQEGLEVFFPAPKFCTDNAAMIALTGYHWLKRGRRDDFALNCCSSSKRSASP